jgi:hypothetical protein
MTCTACGTDVPEAARFCPACGARLGGSEAKSELWESCRISYEDRGYYVFVALVSGPRGSYRLYEPRLTALTVGNQGPASGNPATARSHADLVAILTLDGWEPLGTGTNWWEERFRRKLVHRQWDYAYVTMRRSRFVLETLDATGQETVAEGPKLKGMTAPRKAENGRASHEELVSALCAQAWEPFNSPVTGRWWEQWFRKAAATDQL